MPNSNPVRALFTLTLFISSFLLFLVQPLAGKLILPTFGGAPAVWNASLVFFQLTLLAGYAYAHFSTTWLRGRQPWVHLPVMLLAIIALPFSRATGAWKWVEDQAANGYANPSLVVVAALAILVGLPFFVVSASAPLLQRWFADTDDPKARDPYFLYAASNVGSMLGLFAYPFAFEPSFRLNEQTTAWAVGYGVLIAAFLVCVLVARGRQAASAVSEAAGGETIVSDELPKAITWRDRGWWLILAAVPSSLLTGVTQFVTTNVAPIPLLWVVPLALYLLTFIVAFGEKRLADTRLLSRLSPVVICPLLVVILMEDATVRIAGLHLVAFFFCTWLCHSRLYDLRPSAKQLTEFYLWVSIGGVIGGAFNGLLAPSIFDTLLEYPLAIALVAGLRLPHDPKYRPGNWDLAYTIGVIAITASLIAFTQSPMFGQLAMTLKLQRSGFRTVLAYGIPALLIFLGSDRPLTFFLTTIGVFLTCQFAVTNLPGRLLLRDRSFFGVHVVYQWPGPNLTRFVHGNTLHGIQDSSHPKRALTYYHETGPIGQVFRAFSGEKRKSHVALVGLGVGSLAAYGEPGQRMTFFEIDPKVVEIAHDSKLFSYTRDSQAKIDFVLGDARLTLDRQPDREFGIIVLDAFSSDAIPVHLLTVEAMRMYFDKLEPGGILAVHISNRYLDLEPVVARNAKELGLSAWSQMDAPTKKEEADGKTPSSWMLVVRKKSDLGTLVGRVSYWGESDAFTDFRPWTDDYSNVIGVFSADR